MNGQIHSPSSRKEEKSRPGYKRTIMMALIAIVLSVATYLLLYSLSWLNPGVLTVTSPDGVTQTLYFSTFDGSVALVFFLICVILFTTLITCRAKVVYWGIQLYIWLLGFALAYLSSGNTRIIFYFLLLPRIDNFPYGLFIAIGVSFVLLIFQKQVIHLLSSLLLWPGRRRGAEPHEEYIDERSRNMD